MRKPVYCNRPQKPSKFIKTEVKSGTFTKIVDAVNLGQLVKSIARNAGLSENDAKEMVEIQNCYISYTWNFTPKTKVSLYYKVYNKSINPKYKKQLAKYKADLKTYPTRFALYKKKRAEYEKYIKAKQAKRKIKQLETLGNWSSRVFV